MKDNLKLSALFTLLSAFSYTLVAVIVKRYAEQVTPEIMVFIQLATCLLLGIFVLLSRRATAWPLLMQSRNKRIHVLRTVTSLLNGYLFYYSLKFLPLVNGVLLINVAPLLVPLLGMCFFHKKLYPKLLIAIFVGFIGVACVLNPKANGFNLASVLVLIAALCMALTSLLLRKASEHGDDSFTMSFYFFVFGTILSGLVSIPFWQASTTNAVYLICILSGALLFVVQFTYALAFHYAEASFVSSIYYSNIIFAAIFNVIIFAHYPPMLTYLGIILVITGGLLTIYIQQKINATYQTT